MADLRLTSPAFDTGEDLPKRYFADDEDVSPPLAWEGVPPDARELIILCEDTDHEEGVFTHWVVFGIPPSVTSLPEGLGRTTIVTEPTELYQGLNEMGESGYSGPQHEERPHRLFFRLWALDAELEELPPGASAEEVREAAEGHVIASAELVGIAR